MHSSKASLTSATSFLRDSYLFPMHLSKPSFPRPHNLLLRDSYSSRRVEAHEQAELLPPTTSSSVLPPNPIKCSGSEDEDNNELDFDDMDHTSLKKIKITGHTPRRPTPST
ncbi:hypothetical protein FMUND_3804 [Fusarium mundagurra]|uniref:Uncharacterized protein n=1 Tax=Fusarium mundagurra TaxID=1567541 RepID=A0A8H5Z0S2_9HYPO|nr:hypothetical protein FMUND_3804 [Fusarium mundagurra]